MMIEQQNYYGEPPENNIDRDSIVSNFIEIKFSNPNKTITDSFLVVKETLSRIGILSKQKNTLYQSCHILHKKGKYYIVHFKELFSLDGKPTTITSDDILRRNKIANLLESWGLCVIVNKDVCDVDDVETPIRVNIISHKDKDKYNFVTKYNIGNK
jgi:hypothetical protein